MRRRSSTIAAAVLALGLLASAAASPARAEEERDAEPLETYSAYEGGAPPDDDASPSWWRHLTASDLPSHRWSLGAGLGAPQALRAHALYRRSAKLHYVLEGEFLPVPIGANASVTLWGVDAGARYAISESGWYVGASVGFWSLAYRNNSLSFQGVQGAGVASLNAFYVAPFVGWLWHRTETFTIGSEVGAQAPFYAWGEVNITGSGQDTLAASLRDSSRELMAHYGSLILPRVILIRLSWALP